MRSAIIVFPGSNRERDAARALEQASGQTPRMIWHGETSLPKLDLIVLPGGFSYGDYLRAGAMASVSPVLEAVRKAAAEGVRVLGICNGFQILTESGLLPGALLRNAGLTFLCKPVRLRVETADSPFTALYRPGECLTVPVAHHDGNYQIDPDGLARLEDEDRIAFRYVDAAGEASLAANPNGSVANIAGVLNARRNVLGLMPHPENAIEPDFGGCDGKPLFAGLMEAMA